jgi:hypothetical protein
MTKFIRVRTITNLDVMIRTTAIFTVAKSDAAKHVFITAEDACGNREQFIVEHTMDEIQAMMQAQEAKETP